VPAQPHNRRVLGRGPYPNDRKALRKRDARQSEEEAEGTPIKCASDIIDDGGIEYAREKTSTDVTSFAIFVRKLTSCLSEIL
jgi:hypothetical protein